MKRCNIFAVLLAFALSITLALPAAAETDPHAHEREEGKLTISYLYQDEDGNNYPLKYVDFNLYQVAALTDEDELVRTEAFQSVKLPDGFLADQDLLIEARNTLEYFVDSNSLDPCHVIVTNPQGEAVIDLPLGLYYIDAELFWEDEATGKTVSGYYSTPFLVMIGSVCPESGDYLYDYTAYPKVSKVDVTDDTIRVSVEKVWKNTSHTTKPKEITVSLSRNGTCDITQQKAKLSASNQWSHTWINLDADATWTVCEETELKDYDVSYETKVEDGHFVFIITNTFTGKPDPTPTPTAPSPPPPTEELPQTGSTLPYVPVFAGIGILFLAVGFLLKKAGDHKCS